MFCGGVRVAHLFSFLCCVLWRGSCRSSFKFSVLCFVAGFVSLIFLVFCVVFVAGFVSLILLVFCVVFCSCRSSVFCVVFCGGVRVAHFSFLCCVLWRGSCRSSF